MRIDLKQQRPDLYRPPTGEFAEVGGPPPPEKVRTVLRPPVTDQPSRAG